MLRKIVEAVGTRKLIIAMDANAKHPRWGGRVTDEKGRDLEALVTELGLTVANNKRRGPTYCKGQARTYIDVTLVGQEMAHRVRNWDLLATTSSEHRTITFTVGGRQLDVKGKWDWRWRTKDADWDAYRAELGGKKEELEQFALSGNQSLQQYVRETEQWIVAAAKKVIKRSAGRSRPIVWWTEDLTRKKKETLKWRKKMQRERDEDTRRAYERTWKQKRREYRKEMDTLRRESWQRFVQDEFKRTSWNMVYKLGRKKIKPREAACALGHDDQESRTWEEMADRLLGGLIAEEDTADEHRQLMEEYSHVELDGRRAEVTEEEVREAVHRMAKGKAPGWDGIISEFLIEGIAEIETILVRIYQFCLDKGVFPGRWKKGVIKTLLKGEDRDARDLKSYRPICLLPVLGKVFERIIVGRMERIFKEDIHPRQYGFMPGRGTEDAMLEAGNIVQNRGEKYVLGLFLDISAAFDRVWWPGVLKTLAEMGADKYCFGVIRDYLQHRTVEMREGGRVVKKEVRRGCPQGSVLGPQLWKVVFDGLVRKINEGEAAMVAYADDGAIFIWGNSRKNLEDKGSRVLAAVDDWCRETRMELAAEKTKVMMLKGRFNPTRGPRLKLRNTVIQEVEKIKYLGITWDRGWGISSHIEEILDKASRGFKGIFNHVRKGWSREYRQGLEDMYRGVFLAIVGYGVGAWYPRMLKPGSKAAAKLNGGQRKVIISMIGAYRTISTNAAAVLAGTLPLDLELERRWIAARLRREGRVEWRGEVLQGGRCRAQIRTVLEGVWQQRWSDGATGQWTRQLIPDVTDRRKATWISGDYYLSQMLSGHGNFGGKLEILGLRENGDCPCGEKETAEHVLLECERYEEDRQAMARGIETKLRRAPIAVTDFLSKAGWRYFERFTYKVLRRKEEEDRRAAREGDG